MLIATIITLMFLGSGAGLMADGIDQVHDNIKDRVVNDGTRKAALEVVDKMKDVTSDYEDADNDGENALLRLIQDYTTTTAELQTLLETSYDQRVQYQQKMLRLRFELKNTLSREDWNTVFAQKGASE